MIACPVLRLGEVDSTNRYALQNIDKLPDRQVIVADRQSAGYGRFGRAWVSCGSANLYVSVILKPAMPPGNLETLPALSLYASLKLCELLIDYGVNAEIKWPNDVLVCGRKIAGILGEAVYRGDRLTGFVLGVGVNLNMTGRELESIDRPATSVNLITGKEVDRDLFFDGLLRAFFEGYEGFLAGGFPTIRDEYVKRCGFLGKRVAVRVSDRTCSGTALSFSKRGALVMRADTGETLILTAGEVSLLRSSP